MKSSSAAKPLVGHLALQGVQGTAQSCPQGQAITEPGMCCTDDRLTLCLPYRAHKQHQGVRKGWAVLEEEQQQQTVTWFALPAGDLARLQQPLQPLHLRQGRGVGDGSLEQRAQSVPTAWAAAHSQHTNQAATR